MKLKKLKTGLKNGLYSLYLSLKRYPFAIFFSTLTTIILIVNIYKGYPYGEGGVERLAMVTALGFPFFLCIKSILERKKGLTPVIKVIIHILSIILVFSYIFLLKESNMVSTTRYMAVTISLYLIFLVVPYFFKRENFELYVVRIFSRYLTTIIYTIVLYIGLIAIIFTLNKLLNIPVSWDFYTYTWICSMGIFAPIFFLAGIPEYDETVSIEEYPRILEILLIYIVMPLIAAYTIILYLYFGKILLIREWPQGLLAHLVLWYALITISVLFFVHPLKKKNSWTGFFVKECLFCFYQEPEQTL